MKRNFKIVDGIAIEFGNYYLDLHNDYDLTNITIQIKQQSIIKLSFRKIDESWVNKNNPIQLFLVFEEIMDIDFNENLWMPFSNTIEEIGFKNIGDKDYSSLQNEEQVDLEYSLFFRLENDGYINIYCQTANLVVGNIDLLD